jgi:hypothetical protein
MGEEKKEGEVKGRRKGRVKVRERGGLEIERVE